MYLLSGWVKLPWLLYMGTPLDCTRDETESLVAHVGNLLGKAELLHHELCPPQTLSTTPEDTSAPKPGLCLTDFSENALQKFICLSLAYTINESG